LPSRSNITAAVSLWFLLVGGASAEAPSITSTTQAPADDAAINVVAEKLCRAEPVIGTRIAFKRKCDTPAQLAAFREQAREIIEQYRHRPCAMGVETGENSQVMSC
jgi:hypothetical protein